MDPQSEKINPNPQAESPSPEDGSLKGKANLNSYAQDLDQAYWYVHEHDAAAAATPDELLRIRRKVDWWIVPIMFLCYGMTRGSHLSTVTF